MSLAISLRKITSSRDPWHYTVYHRLLKRLYYRFRNPRYSKYLAAPRPWYEYCIRQAARQGRSLGYPKISILEFGVFNGGGLRCIESLCDVIGPDVGIEFEAYGFDLATGLPRSEDYRDLPYIWSEGYYAMNREEVESSLEFSKLVIGNVADTVETFFASHNPAPIGCVIFDLDFYTSTKNALKIFDDEEGHYLPRIHCFFDDLGTIEQVGGRLAISEFNHEHDTIQLGSNLNIAHNADICGWSIFELHRFAHPDYKRPVSIA